MLDNPDFVGLVLPAIAAFITVVVTAIAVRKERSFVLRAGVPMVCGIALYILLVVLLQKAGVR